MRIRSFATLGLLTLLATACAFGREPMKVSIPFEFHVGATVMPAGQYDLNWASGGKPELLLRSCERDARLWIMTNNVENAHGMRTEGRLVFRVYGETYFLSEVWSRGNEVGSALPKSKIEREVVLRASLAQASEVVLVARR
jgi:hypothetical protein